MRAIIVAVGVAAAVLLPAAASSASWVRIKKVSAPAVCLDVNGHEYSYALLEGSAPATFTVTGPRRIKIASRYVYDDGDARRVPYTVIIDVDGQEVLRRTHTASAKGTVAPCDQEGRVSTRRSAHLDIGSGSHQIRVRAISDGDGRVVARIYREGRATRVTTVPYAPDGHAGVRELQFTSGNHSTYYALTATEPVRFTVGGPTELRVHARLDHDHTMSGSQTYALEVQADGEIWKTFHFDSSKLTTVVYAYTPDVLPGSDNEFRIPVPRGRHTYEIRCLRPERCGVAVQIRIPRADLAQ